MVKSREKKWLQTCRKMIKTLKEKQLKHQETI